MTDDGGVLGNLPRSRPGRRSEKRDAGAKAAPRAERSGARAAKPAQARRRPPAPAPVAEPARAAKPAPPAGGDPVTGALRTVTGLAATGARVANGVAREVLRRLPRP